MIFPTTGTTLAQLVRQCGPAAKLLTQLGIDWRTHRRATLAEAASHAGLDAGAVLEVMLAADVPRRPPTSRDWEQAPLEEVADYVVAAHHTYLRQAMPRIRLLIAKAIEDHGEEHRELLEVRDVFEAFEEEMRRYLLTEEEVLFPLIRQLAMAERHRAPAAGPMDRLMSDVVAEYRHADEAMAQLRGLTHRLRSTSDASPTYRALLEELRQLDRDLQRHEQLEEEVLFPRARAIETAAAREPG